MVGWTESCATTGLRERDEQLRNQNSQAVHCGNITTEGNRGNEGREKPLSHSLRYLRYLLCDPHPVLPLAVAAKRDGRGWRPTPIDAVVADAYGLSRDHYAHVLSTFSHASYKKAPLLKPPHSSVHQNTRISKGANCRPRRALHRAAPVPVVREPHLQAFDRHHLAGGKTQMQSKPGFLLFYAIAA